MKTPDPVPRFLAHAAALVPVAVLAVLISSAFFSAWSGHVVGRMPSKADTEINAEPPSTQVMIIKGDEGEVWNPRFPTELVTELGTPVRANGLPPLDLPENAPRTSKSRFSLFFTVEQPDAPSKVVATTTPGALAMGIFVWLLGLALRNMYVSGSPISLAPVAKLRPEAQATAGQVAQPKAKAKRRGKQGPPPGGRKGKSKGRRR